MTDRLPTSVQCCTCNQVVPVHEAKREVVAWASANKGGSLSNLEGQHFTGKWKCRRCLLGGQEGLAI